MITKTILMTGLVCTSLALAACGETRGERALSGGAIGAGAGAVGGALMGGSPVTGALIAIHRVCTKYLHSLIFTVCPVLNSSIKKGTIQITFLE